MAQQGHRVWAARLVSCFVLISVFGITAVLLWNRFAGEPVDVETSRSMVNASEDPIPVAIQSHALDPLLDFARTALKNHILEHRDYTAVLVKRERLGGRILPQSRMALKLKYGPPVVPNTPERKVSVYLKTLEPKSQKGREVIWVQGRNDDKLTAHESGLLGMITVELLPQSRLAMIGNRYPITEIGIEKLLRKLIEKGERDRRLGPATIRTTENVAMDGRSCRLMEIIHESPTTMVDGKMVEFEFSLAQIYIDVERLIPLKYAGFTWPKIKDGEHELQEEYAYENVSLNVGLAESDFDPRNPLYGF